MLCLNLVLALLDDGLCDVNIQGSWIPEEVGCQSRTKSETCLGHKAGPAQEGWEPTWGFAVGLRWASWEMVLHPSPSGWVWTGRSARTSVDNEAAAINRGVTSISKWRSCVITTRTSFWLTSAFLVQLFSPVDTCCFLQTFPPKMDTQSG